jgi:branched-subunit amino acid aminotransferase/4-amino-4-deoxychorismate lyase
LLDAARDLGWAVIETPAPPSRLATSEGIFLSFSTRGLVPVRALDAHQIPTDARQSLLQDAFLRRCEREWASV